MARYVSRALVRQKVQDPRACFPPPVRFEVGVDGKKFQEMHVDGGAIARLFLDPRSVDISTSGVHVLVLHGRRI